MGSRNNKPGRIVKGTALQPSLKSASGVWSLDEAMQAHRANAWPQPDLFQPVANSLRFSTAKTSYMTRTGNRGGASTTWTWSGWVKPTMYDNGAYNNVMFYAEDPAGTISMVSFEQSPNSPAYRIYVYHNSQNNETTQVFRDPSAWYHITAIADTTNSTSGDRLRLYINGSRVTSFAASASVTQGASGGAGRPNTTYWISKQGPTLARYGDSYLAEVNFVDGYALDPSLFGKFDTDNTWVPIPYTGSYGTNGFYLPFNNATTSQTLGYDASLNGTAIYDADQDPYRGSVALHLTGNGPAGGNNNVFADSSPNNFAITRNGDVTQGSFSPFPRPANTPYNPAINGASAYFDGTGDFLTVPANSAFNLGTGDFTIEFWAYLNPYVAFGGGASYWAEIIGINVGVSDSNSVTNTLGIWQGDGTGSSTVAGEYTVIISGSSTNQQRLHSGITSYNRWSHVALTRNSGTFTLWQDGVSRATASLSADISRNDYVRIGRSINSGIQGSISNIRVIKGTAVYTSAFTPTNRPLGTLTNNLITFSEEFNNSYWTAQSAVVGLTTNAAIAPDGTPSATLLVPSTSSAGQNIAGLHDSAAGVNTFSIFAKSAGYRYIQCFHSRSAGGDAGYVTFDLTTGTVTNSNVWSGSIVNVGNGWYRIIATTSSLAGASANSNVRWAITDGTASRAPVFTGDGTSGIYVWGAQAELASSAGNYTPTPANFRTAPSLLLNFANAAVVDSAGANNITTVSGATITSSSKYGSGAMTFNGSTDHLTTPTNACFTYGTGDFTIEMWVYITANPGSYAYIYAQSANNTTSMSLYIQDGRFKIWNGTNVISGSTLYSLNTWYHVAISRSGTSLRLFLNGFQDGVASNNSSITTGSSFGANIGRWAEIGDSGYFNGSIDDLRVTKGLARYTLAFTPPARALPETGGKSFVTQNVNAGVVQRFTTTGTTSWTAPADVTSVEVLVVAGGGGGANYNSAGGGGAGGLIYNNAYPVTPGQTYTVTVGAGGVGGGVLGNPASDALAAATSGGNSVFGALVAIGGGNGGQGNVQGSRTGDVSPGTGGSGGGARAASAPANAGAAGTAGQGFAGGNSGTYSGPNYPGGGGGGAGGVGGPGVDATTGGNGGVGLQFGISGTSTYYAGGGGGSTQGSGTTTSGGLGGGGAGGGGSGGAFATGVSGTANTGGGGGAGGYNGTTGSGGAGGSGVVIVRYTTTAVGNTSDATTDNLVDSPTQYGHDMGQGGEVVGNYATWNPLLGANYNNSVAIGSSIVVLSNGNLNAYNPALGGSAPKMQCHSNIGMTTGKWYAEFTGLSGRGAGISLGDYILHNGTGSGVSNALVLQPTSGVVNPSTGASATVTGTAVAISTTDVVGVAFDVDNRVCYYYRNGVLTQTASNITTTLGTPYFSSGVWYFSSQPESSGSPSSITANFGQRAWAYAPPAGYNALTTKNFARPAVESAAATPNQYFDTVLYTGTGSARSVTGFNFAPDLLWVKDRSGAGFHRLFDRVRGASNSPSLYSNATSVEGADNLTFTSNGFSYTTDPYSSGMNVNGNLHVAWGWKAGGAAVSNTSGTISSQVSANTASGFSIVTYTGNGTSGSTVGHGLGATPSMVFVKARGAGVYNWRVYHSGLTAGYNVFLNAATAQTQMNTDGFGYIGGVASNTFTLTAGTSNSDAVNASGVTHLAYCWAEVPGFSKFGSYVGNGSVDGPFVYTGFRPAFILTKDITTGTYWWEMVDSARAPFNPSDKTLYANVSDSEYTSSGYNKDLLSNGFKIRGTSGAHNTLGSTYIYMAFAGKSFGNVNGVAR